MEGERGNKDAGKERGGGKWGSPEKGREEKGKEGEKVKLRGIPGPRSHLPPSNLCSNVTFSKRPPLSSLFKMTTVLHPSSTPLTLF